MQKEIADTLKVDIKTVRKYDLFGGQPETTEVAQNLPTGMDESFKPKAPGEPTIEKLVGNLQRRIEALENTVSRQLCVLHNLSEHPEDIQQQCPNCAKDGVIGWASVEKTQLLHREDPTQGRSDILPNLGLYFDVMRCPRCGWSGWKRAL